MAPRNFRDVITMDISASTNEPVEVEENVENETELETMETPAEGHMEPQKKENSEDAIASQDSQSSTTEISSLSSDHGDSPKREPISPMTNDSPKIEATQSC